MRAPMHRGDRGLQSASDVNRVPEHWSPPSPAVAFATHAISITLRSPPSPAVPFATHARSNAPRRPRASKRIGSERDDGRASKESRESSDSTDSIISIISINSIRPTVIPGLLAPPPLAGQTWHGHPARVSWAERPCREDGARTVQGHARSAHLNPHLNPHLSGTLVLLHPLNPLLLTIMGRKGHRGHR